MTMINWHFKINEDVVFIVVCTTFVFYSYGEKNLSILDPDIGFYAELLLLILVDKIFFGLNLM